MAANFTIPGANGQPTPVGQQQYTEYWARTFASDPVIQGEYDKMKRGFGPFGTQANSRAIQTRARELGWTPPDHDWGLEIGQDGQIVPERAGYVDRNADWIAPLIAGGAIAGPFAAAAIAGSGGAAAGGGGTAASGGTAATTGTTAATTAGTGAGTAATTAATGGGIAGMTNALLPRLIDYGSDALGQYVADRQRGNQLEGQNNSNDYRNQLLGTEIGLRGVQTDLDQRRYLDDHYKQKTNESIRGGLLQGMQDVSLSVPEGQGIERASISGGMRPSAIANREQIGSTLQAQAMKELLNPTQPSGVSGQANTPGRLPSIPSAPTYLPTKGPNGVDTAMAGLSMAGQGASLISDLIQQNARRNNPSPLPPQTTYMPPGWEYSEVG